LLQAEQEQEEEEAQTIEFQIVPMFAEIIQQHIMCGKVPN